MRSPVAVHARGQDDGLLVAERLHDGEDLRGRLAGAPDDLGQARARGAAEVELREVADLQRRRSRVVEEEGGGRRRGGEGGTRVRERSSAGRRGRRNVGRSAGVGGREPRRGKDGARATPPGNAPRARARGGANESDRMQPEV